jgi:hypothetical protein
MQNCSYCGSQNTDDNASCVRCGNELAAETGDTKASVKAHALDIDSPKKSRLAQAAFVLAFTSGLQFLLHLSPALAYKWDGIGGDSLALPVIFFLLLTSAGLFSGGLAIYKIQRNNGMLKGLPLAFSAILICILLQVWAFSAVRSLSRHKARSRTASIAIDPRNLKSRVWDACF